MSKINIDITNKHYNNCERKSFDAFNNKMHKKRAKRLETKDKKPLNEREKFLYENNNLFNGKIIECKDGFYKNNGVTHILLTLTKTKTERFYDETKELNRKHPSTNFMPSTIMDERHRKSFLEVTNPNKFGLQRVGEFTPNTPELVRYIRFVVINAFGVSYDSICIDFEIFYSNSFLEEFNKCLIDDFPTDIEYAKIYNGGRESISYSYPMQEGARAQYVDDVLFELKIRIWEFLKCNYSVFDFPQDYIPLSIDEYRTNLNFQDRFIASYDYTIFNKEQLISFCHLDSNNKARDDSLFLDFHNSFRRQFYELGRFRILFFVDEDDYVYVHDSLDFILMYFLQNNVLKEYKRILNSKYELFEKIGNGNYCSLSKIFKDYCNLCLKTSNYQIFLDFNKLEILPFVSDSKLLKGLFESIKASVELLNERNKELDHKINNILTSKNNSSSIKIAVIALFVSILSVLAAIAAIIIPFLSNK